MLSELELGQRKPAEACAVGQVPVVPMMKAEVGEPATVGPVPRVGLRQPYSRPVYAVLGNSSDLQIEELGSRTGSRVRDVLKDSRVHHARCVPRSRDIYKRSCVGRADRSPDNLKLPRRTCRSRAAC